jgi:DNA end-binding protein Ku
MERAIWKGYVEFGLVSIPVALYSAEKKLDLHFKLIDSRNKARIQYVRVNEETGKEVPWNKVMRGYEYEGDNYILFDEKELKEMSDDYSKTINIESFINKDSINSMSFEKPYYLVPDKGGEKGYVILRDTLRSTKKIGIAKMILHTREHLVALMPYEDALLINLLRYAQEIREPKEFDLPSETARKYKISEKEMQIAEQLVNSMTKKWKPTDYQDEFRLTLERWLAQKAKEQKIPHKTARQKSTAKKGDVVDFMTLLKKSLKEKVPKEKTPRRRVARK